MVRAVDVSARPAARARVDLAVTRRLDWATEHWLALANGLVGLSVALPVLAPGLMALGWNQAASYIYLWYSYACHQMPSHSWFLFGYQMAFCERSTAIYLAMFLGGLAYARRRFWTRGLPWWGYALLTIPILIDGGSATLGWRDSTPLLRTLTGSLFGLASAWFVYPLMDRALAQLGSAHEPTPGPA